MHLPRSKRSLLGWLLLILSGVGTAILLFSPVFVIKHVSCQVDGAECPAYLVAELKQHRGESVFSSNIRDTAQRVTQVLPSLREPQFTRSLPDKVTLQFRSSPPAYVLKSEDKTPWVVDASGVIINAEERSDVLQVQVPGSLFETLALRSAVEAELHQALVQLTEIAPALPIQIVAIEVKNRQHVELTLANQKKVICEPAQMEYQLVKLKYLLESLDFSQVPSNVTTIDMRFKYPILQS